METLIETKSEPEVDYLCPKSHRVHGDNIEWRKTSNGTPYPGCKECRNGHRLKYRLKLRATREYNSIGDDSDSSLMEDYLVAEKRSAPWNTLRPRTDAGEIFDEFNEQLKVTEVPCRGRELEFTEYADTRSAYDDENEGRLAPPTRSEARALCAGCPLFDLCGAFARAEKPDYGIWGGVRWQNGRAV